MKKVVITKKNIIKYLIFLFFFLNICAFAGAITPVIGEPYFKEKAMNRAAIVLNEFYIFPLSKIFGNKNLLTKPFYFVRDKLYNKAYSMYPPNEPEREVQWYAVRFTEYDKLYGSMFLKYSKNHPEKIIGNKDLFNWTDEIYYHLNLLSKGSFKDPYFKKYRFGMYSNALWNYLSDRSILFNLTKNNDPYFLNDSEMNRLKKLISNSIDLEAFCKKNEPSGIDYWNTDKFWYTNLIYFKAVIPIINNEIKKNKFNCSSPYLEIYMENYKILTSDLNNSQIPSENKKLINKILNYVLSENILNNYKNKCSIQ